MSFDRKAYCRRYYIEHKEEILAHHRRANSNNREGAAAATRRNYFKRVYGITIEEYDALVEAQGGVCAICKRPEMTKKGNLHVDHDHVSGKVRGLLCIRCNTLLPSLDDPDWLEKARGYLGRNVTHK